MTELNILEEFKIQVMVEVLDNAEMYLSGEKDWESKLQKVIISLIKSDDPVDQAVLMKLPRLTEWVKEAK